MTLINFDKFEKGRKLLESNAPADIDMELLESNGLTVDDIDAINEGFFGDLFGGWFKKFKTKILRKIPGGVLKKVDGIIAGYEAEQIELMQKSLKEKEKIFKAEISKEKQPADAKKFDQIIDRSNQAIKANKKAASAKIDKFNIELEQVADGKSDMVEDYINLKIAEVQEKVAMAELKEIEKFATEEQVEKTAKQVEDKKNKREELQAELESAVKAADDLPGAKAKTGELWLRRNKKGKEVTVEVLDDSTKSKSGELHVKGNDGVEYSAKLDSFIKKADGSKTSRINKIKKEE